MSRRSSRDSASNTRDLILAAATELFAEKGRREVTIRRIAAAAGVNSQLLYYYFKDKDGLFRAVLEQAARRVDDLLSEAADSAASPGVRLQIFIRGWASVAQREAPAMRMLHRAVLEGDQDLSTAVAHHARAHTDRIAALIREGVASGELRADLDPEAAVICLVGSVQYPAITAGLVDGASVAIDDRLGDRIAEMLMNGFKAR